MVNRYRTLRKNPAIREMVAETQLSIADFIVPFFICEGNNIKVEIPSMPDYYRFSLDLAVQEAARLYEAGIKSILLFAKVPDEKKDEPCSEALNFEGLLPKSIRAFKKEIPELIVMSDIALDPYSPFGHDGIVQKGKILNDQTVEVLAKMSVVHAQAGVDLVAPSDMMDNRVKHIRTALESQGFSDTGIMSYSAKYASCFYGPFRDALDSAPGFGDKKTYQMDYRNRQEAIRETLRDIEEGADIVMVKPGLPYLDIIREVRDAVHVPIAAYQVSGEYAMIKAAAANGWLEEDKAILESLYAFKRAGADLIATYFAQKIIENQLL
ncbi:MAG: porphobilinogen synthase [Leptospiraceae bacterium]|nr:porphobilinogen synthase [Leptospiraceae bacterium]